MALLDDDETVIQSVMEHVEEGIVRQFITNELPDNLSDKLVKEIIDELIPYHLVNLRDASYDFCFLYFQTHRGILGGKNLECSCMHLWSYLSSWGMLRNSPLLNLSQAALKPLIEYFDVIAKNIVWDADVDTYAQNKSEIENVYNEIANILTLIMNSVPSITLVTKIMLGVFGCIPAIDTYFFKTFHLLYGGFRNLGSKELENIESFYIKHKNTIDTICVYVIDFNNSKTNYKYKKAKLIDMFGFKLGTILQKYNIK